MPPYDPNNSDMVGWAGETTLDVQYAHTMAPGANILLVETPVSETEGVTGFPQIVTAENYVINHDLGSVISQSFSATEQTFPNKATVEKLRSATRTPPPTTSPSLTATGDSGAADVGLDQETYYLHPVTSLAATSDPLVTGGRRHPAAPERGRPDDLARTRCGTTPTTRPPRSTSSATRARTRWPAAAASPSSSPGPGTRTASKNVVGNQPRRAGHLHERRLQRRR